MHVNVKKIKSVNIVLHSESRFSEKGFEKVVLLMDISGVIK